MVRICVDQGLKVSGIRQFPALMEAVLQDLTCDSDGKVKLYADQQSIESSMSVHDIQPGGRVLIYDMERQHGDNHLLAHHTHSTAWPSAVRRRTWARPG